MHISTSSNANQDHSLEPFQELYQEVLRLVRQKMAKGKVIIMPLMIMRFAPLIQQ